MFSGEIIPFTDVLAEMRRRELSVPSRLADVVVAYRCDRLDLAQIPDAMLMQIGACMQTGNALPAEGRTRADADTAA